LLCERPALVLFCQLLFINCHTRLLSKYSPLTARIPLHPQFTPSCIPQRRYQTPRGLCNTSSAEATELTRMLSVELPPIGILHRVGVRKRHSNIRKSDFDCPSW
jgi:hypothetical protein